MDRRLLLFLPTFSLPFFLKFNTAAVAQGSGLKYEQGLQGLLTGDELTDRALDEAYARGLRKGLQDGHRQGLQAGCEKKK